jgi:hypothetical protein
MVIVNNTSTTAAATSSTTSTTAAAAASAAATASAASTAVAAASSEAAMARHTAEALELLISTLRNSHAGGAADDAGTLLYHCYTLFRIAFDVVSTCIAMLCTNSPAAHCVHVDKCCSV